jgi:transcriptional regulator with XRE-family HTH domain
VADEYYRLQPIVRAVPSPQRSQPATPHLLVRSHGRALAEEILMVDHTDDTPTGLGSTAVDFEDEFESQLQESLADPLVRAAFEDANELHTLLDSLVKLRHALKLSQTEVAKRMSIRQPAVSQFENESSDPRMSTLQRYARAVEAKIRFAIEMPANCDWITCRAGSYSATRVSADPEVDVRSGNLAKQWRDQDGRARGEWTLVA